MSRPPFVNLDAEWLAALGETFIADDDLITGMRLLQAARHLQKLDDQVAHLGTGREYDRGYAAAMERIYSRSNLPPQERAVGQDIASVLNLKEVPVRRIEAPKREPAKLPGKYGHLTLKVNL